jgi:hypothetical protein
MRITLTSVTVADQEQALKFHTGALGFVKKEDVPMDGARRLTVISPQGHDDVELLLEPLGFPPARTYQKGLYDAGTPLTAFEVSNIRA